MRVLFRRIKATAPLVSCWSLSEHEVVFDRLSEAQNEARRLIDCGKFVRILRANGSQISQSEIEASVGLPDTRR
jgi:hypothetical protein